MVPLSMPEILRLTGSSLSLEVLWLNLSGKKMESGGCLITVVNSFRINLCMYMYLDWSNTLFQLQTFSIVSILLHSLIENLSILSIHYILMELGQHKIYPWSANDCT